MSTLIFDISDTKKELNFFINLPSINVFLIFLVKKFFPKTRSNFIGMHQKGKRYIQIKTVSQICFYDGYL